jgi:hypothetical protein
MYILKNYIFNKSLNVAFFKNNNILMLSDFLGSTFFYLPSFFFYLVSPKSINFIFLNYYFFKSFVSHFFYKYISLNFLYVTRLKMKGLGYVIRKITDKLFSFCFFYINFFYLHVPINVIPRSYRKKIIFISNNLEILNMLLKNILLLKKIGPYKFLGLRYPKQIMLLKKKSGKKRK